jgi:Protein of unknown function, DUF481
MNKRIAIGIVYIFFGLPAFAQINESDTTLFQLRTSLSGNLQKGNVEIFTVRSKLDVSYSPMRSLVFKTQNSLLYQSIFRKKADEDIFSRNFLYYQPFRRFYPLAISFISTNFRRKIDYRYFVGLGGTWQIIKQPLHLLKLSSSIVYESSGFGLSDFETDEYDGMKKIQLWRSTLWLFGRHDLLNKRLRFYYDFYWQPALNKSNNFRYQADMGLEFPIWKGLSFNALYTYTHENIVVRNVKQSDQILTFGLAYYLNIHH